MLDKGIGSPGAKNGIDSPNYRSISTTHVGKAGEYFVAGHLLRLGYNVAPLPVDSGVDLIAHWITETGDSRMCLVQVKTTQRKRTSIDFSMQQLDNAARQGVNLIIVFWHEVAVPFALVLPPSLVYMLTSGGFQDPTAPVRKSADAMTIVFESHGKNVYIRNRKNDISGMINRFDRLAPTDVDHFVIPEYAQWSGASGQLVEILSEEEMSG